MNMKWIYRIVGFGIGFGVSQVIYRKFYKPKIDQKMQKLEDEIDQQIDTIVESAFKPDLDAFREETNEQIAKWNEESDRKVEEATEEMKQIVDGFKDKVSQDNEKLMKLANYTPLSDDSFEKYLDHLKESLFGASD